MRVQDASSLFSQFQFEKPAAEIVEAAKRKSAAIETKIREREARIIRLREEHKITDTVLIDVMRQARALQSSGGGDKMSYSVSNTNPQPGAKGLTEDTITIGAGVVNNLLTEQDAIEGERAQVARLGFVIRNLADVPVFSSGSDGATRLGVRGHRLSYSELEFLGF